MYTINYQLLEPLFEASNFPLLFQVVREPILFRIVVAFENRFLKEYCHTTVIGAQFAADGYFF